MTRRALLPTISALVFAAICLSAYAESIPSTDGRDIEMLAEDNTAFAIALYKRLSQQTENLVISPYGLSSAVAMLYAGAEGETARQIRETFHFTLEDESLHALFSSLRRALESASTDGEVELSIVEAAWPQKGYPLSESYRFLLQKYYDAEWIPLDFSQNAEKARSTINQWVKNETKGKISNLIPEGLLDPLTRLVLTNAVYFKGAWKTPFPAESTRIAVFHRSDGGKVETAFMHQTSEFGYLETDRYQLLLMPYGSGNISMIILLPKPGENLEDLENRLTGQHIRHWSRNALLKKVKVYLPKFTIHSSFKLEEILTAMGMVDAFTPKADFSRMEKTGELYVSTVLQKAFIAVDEKGAEAAAATAVIMTRGLSKEKLSIPEFRADHPFLFMIRHDITGILLFMGKIEDPSI